MSGRSSSRVVFIVGTVGALITGCTQPNPDTAAGRSDIAGQQCALCMAENPGARPGQLARLLRLAPSSVATLANSLRQADLVTRTGGEADRRTACLRLTPAGAPCRHRNTDDRAYRL